MIFEIASQAAAAAATPYVYTQEHLKYFFQAMTYAGAFAAIGFAAMGAAYGCGISCASAIGAWKKCYAAGKPAPFIMIAFSGAPLTQTIYGFLLMNFIRNANCDPGMALGIGLFCGLAIGLSALFQGKCAAAAADALGATGKGTANYFIVIGIVETVALFTLVFGLLLLNS